MTTLEASQRTRLNYENLVDGEWLSSKTEGRFAVRSAVQPDERLGTWPRSGDEELAAVAAAWERPPRACTSDRLAEVLASAKERITADGQGNDLCAANLGFARGEWASSTLFPPEQQAQPADENITVLVAHWSLLVEGVWKTIAKELQGGRRVLVFADPSVPTMADLVVRSLVEGGLPSDRLALLHGPAEGLVAKALSLPSVASVFAVGSALRIKELRRSAEEARVAEQVLRIPRAGARDIDDKEDLGRAARAIVESAFGRRSTFSGQLPGQLARVYCPERRLSQLTELLLEVLHEAPDVAAPLPFVGREEAETTRRVRALGLDEGATPIFGGEDQDGEGNRFAHPGVFTNVEPFMESARRIEPAPVLCLLRV